MRIMIDITDNVQKESVIITEASTLGFPPGRWPFTLEVGQKVFKLVGRMYCQRGADVPFVIYATDNGDLLKVFND